MKYKIKRTKAGLKFSVEVPEEMLKDEGVLQVALGITFKDHALEMFNRALDKAGVPQV